MRLDVGQPYPRDVAALPAGVVEKRVLELPVQVGDQDGALWIDSKREAGHQRAARRSSWRSIAGHVSHARQPAYRRPARLEHSCRASPKARRTGD